MGQIGKGLDYVKSIPCILKIVEIVVLLIAFALVGHFLNEIPNGYFSYFGKKGNLEFFLFATIVGWMISIAFLVIFVIGIHEKISALPWPLVVAIVSAVWTILLLIASALLAAAAKDYDDDIQLISGATAINACKILDNSKADSQCGQIVGGT
ncbi:pre-mRNA-splicing factor CWC25 homolog, partial [Paramuricea clavata]